MDGIIDYIKQAFTPESQAAFLKKLLMCAAIAVAAVLIQKLGRRAIRRGFAHAKKTAGKGSAAKIEMTLAIVLGIYKYVILVIAVFLALQTFDVNLSSVVTLAGIGGIAVGIGAQSLIKDFLNGLFILFENQYAIGDTITIAGQSGKVVEFNLRTTKLLGEDGELYIVPNSEIHIVKNSSGA